MKVQSVCVFCGANSGVRPDYRAAARQVGATLARKGLRLVFGGSGIGTMQDLANAALDAGGSVVGVIPRILVDREQAHRGVTQLHIVDSLHERKALMADLADAFIALPGGLGTLDEILEMLTWAQLGIQRKPCGLLNVNRYYAKLIEFLDVACDEGFLHERFRALILVAEDVEQLLTRFEQMSSNAPNS
jgi:uncharacterized protein (TIGR00730 family)